jgi:hypothetical protein
MTVGDVNAVIALILAGAITLWATLLTFGIIFGEKSRRAAQLTESAPGKCIGIGALLGVSGIGIGLGLVNLKGVGGLLGWILLVGVLFLATIGASGLSRIAGARIRALSATQSELAGMARGAALLVLSGLLPGLGWLLVFPLQLFASIGAGMQAVFGRESLAAKREAQAQQQ